MPLWTLLLAATATVAEAQPAGPAARATDRRVAPPESVTVAAGTHYRGSGFRRWLLGGTYRTLWTTPIRVPVLDLDTYAGGLHMTKTGGGKQTKSLRFETADGTEYVFRQSDKSVNSVPMMFRETAIYGFFQDQVSAMHPAASVVIDPLLSASGVRHARSEFMVLTSAADIGDSRAEFAGRLGTMERFPNVPKHARGFDDAESIIDSDSLLTLLNAGGSSLVNARAFLAARLVDMVLNDNDRHAGNWKWARLTASASWEPIARDRDHALVSYDGVIMRLTRVLSPALPSFNGETKVNSLTLPRQLDARLLNGLPRAVWDSVALALRARMSDSVIETSVQTLPPEFRASAARLAATLRARRDALPRTAAAFYTLLAARVEIHGTDTADRIYVTRISDTVVAVGIESARAPIFSRRFRSRETNEILIYTHGGADTAYVSGHVARSITVRIIGGNGTNVFTDSSEVGGAAYPTRLYGLGIVNHVQYEKDTLFDRRPWEVIDGALVPHQRDDGASYEIITGLSKHRGMGLSPRLGLRRLTYGFNHRPYSSMLQVDGEYAVGFGGGRLRLFGDKRFESSAVHLTVRALASTIEVVRFSGYGNRTVDDAVGQAVAQSTLSLFPAIARAVGTRLDFSVGPLLTRTTTDSARSLGLGASAARGLGRATQVGARATMRYAWQDRGRTVSTPAQKVLVELASTWTAAALDNQSAYTKHTALVGAAIDIPVPLHPMLVVRAGGAKLTGAFPYFDAATIGGNSTTRYMDQQRYVGDASLFGTTELRVPVAHFRFLMPIRAGVFGLAEAGRVYVDGVSSGDWHGQSGYGVWFSRGHASPTLSLARTSERGHAGLHLRFGLDF